MRQHGPAGILIEYICIDVLGFWAHLIRLDPCSIYWFVLQTIDWTIEMAALPFLVVLRGFTIIYYKEEFSDSWIDLIIALAGSGWLLFWEKGLRPVRAAARFVGRCVECVIIACLDISEKPAAQRLWQWTLSPLLHSGITRVTWVLDLAQKLVLHLVSVMATISWQVIKKCIPSGRSNWEREDREVLLRGKSQKGKPKPKAKNVAPDRSAHSAKQPLGKAPNRAAPSQTPHRSSPVKDKEQVPDGARSGLFSTLQQAATLQTERLPKAPTNQPSGSQQPIPAPLSHARASDAPTLVPDDQTQQAAAGMEQEGFQEAARKRQKQKQKKTKGVNHATAAGTDSAHTVSAVPSIARASNGNVTAPETLSPPAADEGSKLVTLAAEATQSTVAPDQDTGLSSGADFGSGSNEQQHKGSGETCRGAITAASVARAPVSSLASGAQLLWAFSVLNSLSLSSHHLHFIHSVTVVVWLLIAPLACCLCS